ncbi:MAG: tetraacyldisaccharide 4'-kinase [Chitinivibrionales bacterium]|nr:tetraacyldisaccharide 4'-kinase [Chitinivibrionales bacterium]
MQPLPQNNLTSLLSRLYARIITFRNNYFDGHPAQSRFVGLPVVSVGAIHTGGVGKTPLCITIGRHFQEQGYAIGFLSRGYGRKSSQTVITRPEEQLTWQHVGDEPCALQSNVAGAWLGIGAKRIISARRLERMMPRQSLLIMDDGFQHRRMHRDLDIVCLPAHGAGGNVLPTGYLREPAESLRRASIICIIGSKEEREIMRMHMHRVGSVAGHDRLFVLHQQAASWVNAATLQESKKPPAKKSAVICGIARPERFILMLRQSGIEPESVHTFNDHHIFTEHEIRGCLGAQTQVILTTEKDAFRLKALSLVNCPDIWYLKIGLEFENNRLRKQFLSEVEYEVQGKLC